MKNTIYQIYAKYTENGRYRNITGVITDGVHGTENPQRAERFANAACKWNAKVKVIVTDPNGVKNEIIYK